MTDDGGELRVCVDGKQRLTSIYRYVRIVGARSLVLAVPFIAIDLSFRVDSSLARYVSVVFEWWFHVTHVLFEDSM